MNLAHGQYSFGRSILVSLYFTLFHSSFGGIPLQIILVHLRVACTDIANGSWKNISDNDAIFYTGDSNSRLSSSLFIVLSCSVNQLQISKGK